MIRLTTHPKLASTLAFTLCPGTSFGCLKRNNTKPVTIWQQTHMQLKMLFLGKLHNWVIKYWPFCLGEKVKYHSEPK